MGCSKTANGASVANGLVYRSNQLYNISEGDMHLLAELTLKNDFDLRTASERNAKPDELPVGVNNYWLDVMADYPAAGPANLMELLSDSLNANDEPGDGRIEEMLKLHTDNLLHCQMHKQLAEFFFLEINRWV